LANISVKFGLPCASSSNFADIIHYLAVIPAVVPCAPSSSSTSFEFREKLQGNTKRNTATKWLKLTIQL
jgi:hypothetical protein